MSESGPSSAALREALETLAKGGFVIVVDREERENEGDLFLAAEFATPEALAFLVRYTSGIICTPMKAARAAELGLGLMVAANSEAHRTAFTVSVDLRHGTSTGVSATDRALTIRALASPQTRPDDLARPGHVFPLIAADGGIVARPGHTEASVELMEWANLTPVAVLAELVNDDGTMQRLPELESFSRKHGIPLVRIEDIEAHARHLRSKVG